MATELQRPTVDQADVKTVLDLEVPLRKLVEAIAAAGPAMNRLEAAGYPGCDGRYSPRDHLESLAYNLSVGPESQPVCGALHMLERMRIGAGNQAALDYTVFVVEHQLDLDQAVAALVD